MQQAFVEQSMVLERIARRTGLFGNPEYAGISICREINTVHKVSSSSVGLSLHQLQQEPYVCCCIQESYNDIHAD